VALDGESWFSARRCITAFDRALFA
jgi:hypothetical protein